MYQYNRTVAEARAALDGGAGSAAAGGAAMAANLSRRGLFKVGGAAATGAVIGRSAPVSVGARQDAPIELRMAWWGGDARHEMMNGLLDTYEADHPGVTILREYTDFGPYWERLATQVAGGNAPDLMHFNLSYTGEYGRKGVVMDLAPLIEQGLIDTEDFDPVILDSGRVDGTLYYISLGNSAPSTIYNTRLFDEAGVEVPAADWTWDDFAATAKAITEALGEGFYGSSDQAAYSDAFEIFLRQRGKSVFGDDGRLNFEQQDLVDWLAFWDDLRQAGAIPPTDVAVETSESQDTGVLATGDAAMHLIPANQLKIWQRFLEDDLALAFVPRSADGEDTGYFVVGAYIGISANTPNPEAAAEVVNYMVNDPEAAKVYKAEHGPPISLAIRDIVAPELDPSDREVFAFMGEVTQTATPISPQPPQYAAIIDLLDRTNQSVGFGEATVEEAATNFFDEAETILI
jgi:multiple sugar transport system substrate-binding protein